MALMLAIIGSFLQTFVDEAVFRTLGPTDQQRPELAHRAGKQQIQKLCKDSWAASSFSAKENLGSSGAAKNIGWSRRAVNWAMVQTCCAGGWCACKAAARPAKAYSRTARPRFQEGFSHMTLDLLPGSLDRQAT